MIAAAAGRLAAGALAGALAGLLAGCGQLKVTVDVLDPAYARDQVHDERLRKAYRDIVAAPPGHYAAADRKRLVDFQTEVARLAATYVEAGARLPDAQRKALAQIAGDLATGVRGPALAGQADAKGRELEGLAAAVRSDVAAAGWSGRGPVPQGLREQLAAFEASSRWLQPVAARTLAEMRADLLRIAALAPAAAPAAAPASAIAAAVKPQEAVVRAVAARSLIQGGEIADSEYAHAVAAAPPELWATRYNQAFGSGYLGNVDVVIRMNSTADFSVKGMRFDASTVSKVASKVMTQGLLMAAQVAGVPVATARSGTQTGGDALSGASSELASAEAALARRQVAQQARRDAVRALAQTVLALHPSLTAPDLAGADAAARATLHRSVDDTLAALKDLLKMQDLN